MAESNEDQVSKPKKDCICSLCIESKLQTPLECAWRECTRPRKHRSSFCGTNHIPDFS